jgi:flagellar assembly protein FliH
MSISSSRSGIDSPESRRHASERFMFEVSFDQPEPIPEDLPPPPPVFSEEEVAAAAEQAYAQGFEEGKQAALDSLEQQLVNQLESFRRELADLAKVKMQQDVQVTSQAVGLTVASLKQLLPSLNATQAITEISELLSQAIKQQLSHATLVIRLHPSLVEPLGKYFVGEDIKLVGDNAQAVGDCTITWPGGSLARRAHQAVAEVYTKLEAYLVIAPQGVVEQEDAGFPQPAAVSSSQVTTPSLGEQADPAALHGQSPDMPEETVMNAAADIGDEAREEDGDTNIDTHLNPTPWPADDLATDISELANPDDTQTGEMV